MKTNLYLTPLLLSLALFCGCSRSGQQHFSVSGTITDASGKVLYLETTSSDEAQTLDSVVLGQDGHFSFEGEGHAYPMFYRLRLGEESIPFAADSLTQLSLTASGDSLFASYRLTKAEAYNEQIREISHLRWQTDRAIEAFIASLPTLKITQEGIEQHIDSLSGGLKEVLKSRYIYADPKSPAAYFAL